MGLFNSVRTSFYGTRRNAKPGYCSDSRWTPSAAAPELQEEIREITSGGSSRSSSSEAGFPTRQRRSEDSISSSIARASCRRSIDVCRRPGRASLDERPVGTAKFDRRSLDIARASGPKELRLPQLPRKPEIQDCTFVNPNRNSPLLGTSAPAPKWRSNDGRPESRRASEAMRPSPINRASKNQPPQVISAGPTEASCTALKMQKSLHKAEIMPCQAGVNSLASAQPQPSRPRASIDMGDFHWRNRSITPDPNAIVDRASRIQFSDPVSRRSASVEPLEWPTSTQVFDIFANAPCLHQNEAKELVTHQVTNSCASSWRSDKTQTGVLQQAPVTEKKLRKGRDPRQQAAEFEDRMAELFNLTPRQGSLARSSKWHVNSQIELEDPAERILQQNLEVIDSTSEEKCDVLGTTGSMEGLTIGVASEREKAMLAAITGASKFAMKMKALDRKGLPRATRNQGMKNGSFPVRRVHGADKDDIQAEKDQVTFERQIEAVFESFSLYGKWCPEQIMVQEQRSKGMGSLRFLTVCREAGLMDNYAITPSVIRNLFSKYMKMSTCLMSFQNFIFALMELTELNGWPAERILQSVVKLNSEGHLFIHHTNPF